MQRFWMEDFIQVLIKLGIKVHPYVNSHFSNGVHNILSDVFGFFDFYHAGNVENMDKTGWIGVIRRPKQDVWAIDQTGVYKRYDNDYVSHFYTEEENDKIAHSTGKGLRCDEKTIYKNIQKTTKYYLRIDLPANRKNLYMPPVIN